MSAVLVHESGIVTNVGVAVGIEPQANIYISGVGGHQQEFRLSANGAQYRQTAVSYTGPAWFEM